VRKTSSVVLHVLNLEEEMVDDLQQQEQEIDFEDLLFNSSATVSISVTCILLSIAFAILVSLF
jgi:hypothetical protein